MLNPARITAVWHFCRIALYLNRIVNFSLRQGCAVHFALGARSGTLVHARRFAVNRAIRRSTHGLGKKTVNPLKIAIAVEPIPAGLGQRLAGCACHPSSPTLPSKKRAVRMRRPSSFGT